MPLFVKFCPNIASFMQILCDSLLLYTVHRVSYLLNSLYSLRVSVLLHSTISCRLSMYRWTSFHWLRILDGSIPSIHISLKNVWKVCFLPHEQFSFPLKNSCISQISISLKDSGINFESSVMSFRFKGAFKLRKSRCEAATLWIITASQCK